MVKGLLMIFIFEQGDPITYLKQVPVFGKFDKLELHQGIVAHVTTYEDDVPMSFYYRVQGETGYISDTESFFSKRDAIENVRKLLTARCTQCELLKLNIHTRENKVMGEWDKEALVQHEAYITMYQEFLEEHKY